MGGCKDVCPFSHRIGQGLSDKSYFYLEVYDEMYSRRLGER
jgi:hypothetical protein